MASTGRELGLYERFSHSSQRRRRAFGGSKAAALERAISDLLNEFPLLRGRIEGRYTRTPRFIERDATSVSDILDVVRDDDSSTRVEGSPSPDEVLTTRLEAGLHQANEMDVSVGPLWKVLHHDRKDEQSIVLVVHHTLSDGLGSKNLFAQLIQRATRPDETQVQIPSLLIPFEHIPQSQEQSVPGLRRMHWSFMAGIMWAEVIRPFWPFRLIASKRATVLPNPPLVPPYQQSTELRIIRSPNELMARIKARARAKGVNDANDLLMDEILLKTPVSVRDAALGHPITTGNYVATISTPPSFKAATLSTGFYSLTRSCASHISSPAERTRAEQMMLTLSLIPDPASAAEAPVEQGTGWETWLREKMENEVGTWSCTIDVSNLGVFPVPKDVAEEIEVLGWAQPGSAMGAAIGTNVRLCFASSPPLLQGVHADPSLGTIQIMSSPASGCELVVTLSYRRGTIKDALLDHVCGNFPRVLERLGRLDDSDEGVTLADLTK
ncbi:BQ5605_C007g04539 [Microbotryum silenes-dioicae]|uniref:BQ5605_C007g04539 protein n=1 Tax=Microbotryum silenes-dioicae TaxID=796604 RepID=A0A2X0MUF7_9BASI|nr:BQ5605_C007g04539 [Microbotryum silenes-dioicae]